MNEDQQNTTSDSLSSDDNTNKNSPVNPTSSDPLNRTSYLIQHQLALTKEKFKIEDGAGTVLLWAVTPSITLKKEFRVYTDEANTQEVLDIKIHKVLELTEKWDVSEAGGTTLLGSINSEAHITPKWKIMNAQEQQIAEASEDGKNMIEHDLVGARRKFVVIADGVTVATYDQSYESLMLNFTMDFSQDTQNILGRRLGIALGIVIAHKALLENEHNHNGNLGAIGGIGSLGNIGGIGGGGIRL